MTVPITSLNRAQFAEFLPTAQSIRWAESLTAAAQSFVSTGGGGSLTPSGVTPGSYGTNSSVGAFTVDINGIITAAANTPIAIAFTQVSGTVPIAQGGTGQVTANAALNALLPSQGGNTGYYLQTNGTDASWQPAPGGGGGGTVTQVNTTAGDLTGGPITVTGTLGLATTGVTAATYGSATQVAQVAVDTKGRITTASSVAIAISFSQVSGTVPVNQGGTGATSLTGYVKSNGASPFTASATIPVADLSGTLGVPAGGTGATTLTGYVKGNGTSAFTAAASIPQADVTNLVSDLALKAPLASPTFTGVPAAPTAAGGTNTTQIATTAFVTSAVAGKAASSITLTGTLSISGGGDLTANRTFSLVNDSASPGVLKYYGTDSGGTKGFYTLPSPGTGVTLVTSTGGSLTVTNPAGPTVNVDIAAPVSTANGGTGLITSWYVASIAAMVALTKASLINGQICLVEGYYAAGDLGGGSFVWDSASTATTNIGTCFQAAAGGTGRWLRIDPILTVRHFGAKGDSATNDTVAVQAAIDVTCALGRDLLFPQGGYIVDPITTPSGSGGIFNISGEPGAVLLARTASMTILSVPNDQTLAGPRMLSGLTFNGQSLSNVTGLKLGDATGLALLRMNVTDVTVRSCYIGVEISDVQVSSFYNLQCQSNTFGFIAKSDPTGGGSTNLNFDGLRLQSNYVGFVGISASVYGIGGWQFDNALIQESALCGMALFGALGGNGKIDDVNMDCPHFEGNGLGTVPSDTIAIYGQTVRRAAIQLEGADLILNSGITGNPYGNMPTLYGRTNSSYMVRDTSLGGGILQTDFDDTSRIFLDGMTEITGVIGRIASWDGFYYNYGTGGVVQGEALVAPSTFPANYYRGPGLFPDAPEAENPIGVAVAKVWDAEQGYVQQVTYGAGTGSVSSNVVNFTPIQQNIAIGDAVAITVLMRADSATTMVLYPSLASQLIGPTAVNLTTQWQRYVVYGTASSAAAGGYLLFAYPAVTGGPVVYFAKMMAVYVPTGSDLLPLNETVRVGLYNNTRVPMYAPAAPTTGTWPVGARVINSVPAVGNPKAWSCTAAGTPGTWVSEGNL